MKSILKKLLWDERGSALVIVALAMVVLMGFAALVIDVGLLYVERARLMDTADASALAGAQDIYLSPEKAEEMAEEYVIKNGYDIQGFDIYVDKDNKTITVGALGRVNLFFARIWNHASGEVGARASAQIAGITSATGVSPLGIEDQTLEKYKLYTLKVGSSSTGGNFGALTLGLPGANSYRENLMYGYDELLSVGDIIETETLTNSIQFFLLHWNFYYNFSSLPWDAVYFYFTI